jgi:hypothetical protein
MRYLFENILIGNWTPLGLGTIGAFFFLMLSACATTPNTPYHLTCQGKCSESEFLSAVEKRHVFLSAYGVAAHPCKPKPHDLDVQYDQAWLEVREDGYLWNPNQLEAIRLRIAKARQDGKQVLLAVFVHGWNDNAEETPPWTDPAKCSEQRQGMASRFPFMMARVTDSVQRLYSDQRKGKDTPVVIGVWVGWRGKDYLADGLALVGSFQSRGSVATQIGLQTGYEAGSGAPSLHAAIDTLSADINADPKGKDRVLLWGLSFGGRIITRMFLKPDAWNIAPLGPRNLVVTMNAAVGSDCFESPFLANRNGDTRTGGPTWINFSNSMDVARSQFYPIGTALLGDRPCDAGSTAKHLAIGFDPRLVTHILRISLENWDKVWPTPVAHEFGPRTWSTAKAGNAILRQAHATQSGSGLPKYSDQDVHYNYVCFSPLQQSGHLWTVSVDDSVVDRASKELKDTDRERSDREESYSRLMSDWSLARLVQLASDKDLNAMQLDYHVNVIQTNLIRLIVLALYDPARTGAGCCTTGTRSKGMPASDGPTVEAVSLAMKKPCKLPGPSELRGR